MMETKPTGKSRDERREFWQMHLRAWATGGGTLKAYAEAHGLSVRSLYGARSRLERGPRSRAVAHDATSPRFVPVRVTSTAAAPSESGMVRVRLRNGVVLEVPVDVDGASCQWLLEVAGRLP
jgi:hypothetical protein